MGSAGGGQDFGTESKTGATSFQTTEQAALMQSFGNWLLPMVGQGVPAYPGQGVAGFNQDQYDAFARTRSLAGQPMALGSELGGALSNALQGIPLTPYDPAATQDFFESTIYNPGKRAFTEDILPLVEEQYGGPGYYGSARQQGVTGAITDFGQGMDQTLAGLQYAGKENERQSINDAYLASLDPSLKFGQQSADYANTQADRLLGIGTMQQVLDQANIDFDIKKYYYERPENSPYIDMIMNYLGLKTKDTFAMQEDQGAWNAEVGIMSK